MKNGKKRTNEDGSKIWRLNGKFHRTDGPAIEWANGDKYWYQNDKFHRTDGPAIEWANGDKYWYQNGKLHRTDGPAMEYANGSKVWYLNGIYYGDGDTPPTDYTLATLILEGLSQ